MALFDGMEQKRPGPAKEVAQLQKLAAWYRDWAKVAGNAAERESRLRLAEYLEAKARALGAPNG